MTNPDTNGHARERVALYLRVSSEEQRDAGTIQTQAEVLRAHAERMGFEIVETYADDGLSGVIPLHERPAGRKLLADAREGKFQTVLVYRVDRVARTQLGILDAADRLERVGVALRSATEHYETATPQGRLMFQMLGSFSEFERSTIRERTRDGYHRALREGKTSGIIPYGYDVDEAGRLVANPEEAEVVRAIFENVAAGATLYSEATRLNTLGIAAPGRKYGRGPRRHSAKWTVSTLSKLIRRSVYTGTRRIKINGGAGLIEDAAPSIVEPELQQKAMRALAENKRFNRRRGDRRYLLAGLIRCEVCGATCVGHPSTTRGKRRHYYVCGDNRPERRLRAGKGHAPYVHAPWLEELVWADVRRFFDDPGAVLEQAREQMESDEATIELEERSADLTERLAAKHKERDRWLYLYAQGHISDAELEIHLADLRPQLDNLGLLLESVEGELEARLEHARVAESAEAWLLTLRDRVEEVEADTPEGFAKRRELVKLLVDRIDAGRDENGRTRVKIRYRFRPCEPPEEDHRMLPELTTPRAGPTRSRARTPGRSPEGNESSGSRPWLPTPSI